MKIIDLINNLLKYIILTDDKIGKIVFSYCITLYSDNEYLLTSKRRPFSVKLHDSYYDNLL